MKSSRSTILFNIILLASAWLLLNCGWGGDEEPRSFFAPETGLKGKGHPVFYAPNTPFYNNGSSPADFSAYNEKEWMGFFDNTIPDTIIRFWLNDAEANQSIAFQQWVTGKSKTISDTSLLKHKKYFKKNKKSISFFTYLSYALQLQQEVKRNWDYYEILDIDTTLISKASGFLQTMNMQVEQENSAFIKTRYYYQIERLYYRTGRYDDGISFWKKHEKMLVNNSSYYRFMGYAAANYYKKGAYQESNFLYALLYDRFEPMREAALWSFSLREELDWKKSLEFTSDKHMQCVLWQIHGFLTDEGEAMEQIFKLDPKSETLTTLLMRAVNVEEAKFIHMPYYERYNIQSYDLNASQNDLNMLSLVERIASTESTLDPALWHLVASYFNTATGDFEKAKIYLLKSKQQPNQSKLFISQTHIVELLYDIKLSTSIVESEKIDSAFESRMVKHFQWINAHAKDSFLRTSDLLAWCKLYLSDIYESRNAIASECFHAGSVDGFYTLENIEALMEFLLKPSKTEFEQILANSYTYGIPDLNTLKMFALLYQGSFGDASKMNARLNLESKSADDYLYADPFVIHIRDCHDCDVEASQAKKYNRAHIIDTLAILEAEALWKPEKASEIYFAIANCLYNITYYGNARKFYGINMSELSYEEDGHHSYLLPVFNCQLSESFYRKAMHASTNNEFNTKCLFMIAKCRQNQGYQATENHPSDEAQNELDAYNRDTVYNQLIQNYAHTEYYKQIIEECGYFKSYLDKR